MFAMFASGFQVVKAVIQLLWVRLKLRLQHFFLRLKLRASLNILNPNGFHTQITALQAAGFQVYQAPMGYQRLVDLMEKRVKATFTQDDWSTFIEAVTRTQQILGMATIYVGENLLWIQGPYEHHFHYYKLPPPFWI